MKTKNELYLAWIVADLKKKVLFIPKRVKVFSKVLGRGEADLYWEYKNRYPEFSEVIVYE